MTSSTVVLVPGFWLGGWAWDAVAADLRRLGNDVVQATLPGLESSYVAPVTLAEQIEAVTAIVADAAGRVTLVGHSGAGAIITGAADTAPDRIAELVFVDSGPAADGAIAAPDLDAEIDSIALPVWSELEEGGSSLVGLDEDALTVFRERAVPHPAGPAREPLHLADERRHGIPVTLICTSFPAEQVRAMADAGHPWFAELGRFETVELVDLPPGHWPMWSRPAELAEVIAGIADSSA